VTGTTGAIAAPADPLGPVPLAGFTLEPAWPLRLWRCPPLTLAVVSVAWLRGLDDGHRADLVRRHLDVREADQAPRVRLPKRRHEWLAGRLAVKHCAAGHQAGQTGQRIPTRQVLVGPVASGIRKGRLLVSAPADVSLSHSGDFAIAACGDGPVGIDLERERELAPPLAAMLLDEEVGAEMPLALRWTCKEAVLKCLGVGLRVDSREVMLTSWDRDGRFGWRAGARLQAVVPGADPGRVRTWAGQVDGYLLAVAWVAGPGTPWARS
jgi:4'-phosphopantetheinyl transferase